MSLHTLTPAAAWAEEEFLPAGSSDQALAGQTQQGHVEHAHFQTTVWHAFDPAMRSCRASRGKANSPCLCVSTRLHTVRVIPKSISFFSWLGYNLYRQVGWGRKKKKAGNGVQSKAKALDTGRCVLAGAVITIGGVWSSSHQCFLLGESHFSVC